MAHSSFKGDQDFDTYQSWNCICALYGAEDRRLELVMNHLNHKRMILIDLGRIILCICAVRTVLCLSFSYEILSNALFGYLFLLLPQAIAVLN